MAQVNAKEVRQSGGELVIPVLAVAFTLYYFSTIIDSPWTAQVSAFIVGGVLLVLCTLFFVKTGLAVKARKANLGFGSLFGFRDLTSGRLGLFIVTIGYCLFIDQAGFTLTTFLFLFIGMAILSHGRRLLLIGLISSIMALGGWLLFIVAFETRFPRGWFEEMMKSVLTNG